MSQAYVYLFVDQANTMATKRWPPYAHFYILNGVFMDLNLPKRVLDVQGIKVPNQNFYPSLPEARLEILCLAYIAILLLYKTPVTCVVCADKTFSKTSNMTYSVLREW